MLFNQFFIYSSKVSYILSGFELSSAFFTFNSYEFSTRNFLLKTDHKWFKKDYHDNFFFVKTQKVDKDFSKISIISFEFIFISLSCTSRSLILKDFSSL